MLRFSYEAQIGGVQELVCCALLNDMISIGFCFFAGVAKPKPHSFLVFVSYTVGEGRGANTDFSVS